MVARAGVASPQIVAVADFNSDGQPDLVVSDVIRTGEMQAWFLVEHLVDTPLVRA